MTSGWKAFYQAKTIFITGAASGLGRELSLDLAAAGARLILTDINQERLEEVALEAKSKGCEVVFKALDIRDYEKLLQLKEIIPASWQVDIVMANAGVGGVNPAYGFSREIDQKIMSINYFGTVNAFDLFLPEMIKRKKGDLVGVSSLASMRGLPEACSYSASKVAQSHLLESWRLDLKKHNIHVLSVFPGFIKTPMTDHDEFPLPFMVTTQEASRLILKSLAKRKKQLAFPKVMAWASLLNKYLPNFLYELIFSTFNPSKGDKKARLF